MRLSFFQLIAFLLGITIHEYCHALVAYLLGDSTAKKQQRLTLNPLAHIDPLGLLCLIILGFGWARPVPFNAHNFRFPRFYSILVALAGPFSNLLIAFVSLLLMRALPHNLTPVWAVFLLGFFDAASRINVMLSIFNLIPFPPLDGSHFLRVLIPDKWEEYYNSFQKYSIFLLLILINTPWFGRSFYYLMNRTLSFLNHLIDFITLS